MISYSEILKKAILLQESEVPFVIFRRPNEKQINLYNQIDNQVYIFEDSFANEGFVLAPFQNITHKKILLKSEEKYVANVEDFHFQFSDRKLPFDEGQKQNHIKLIKKAVQTMQNSELHKVVLSRKIAVPYHKNPVEIFQKMIENYPTAFCYLFSHPKVGVWLAATPETLLKFSENQLYTMALAGTQPFKEGIITWQQKEREEQQIVTDDILDKIKFYTENKKVSEPKTVRAGGVVHLCTHITADLQADKNPFDVVTQLHPTPAVCGFPFEAAQQFILENESYDRIFYTGYCGVVEQQKFDFYVNLRCMQLEENQAYIYVGGGVLKESIPDSEWDETQNKAQTMFRIL